MGIIYKPEEHRWNTEVVLEEAASCIHRNTEANSGGNIQGDQTTEQGNPSNNRRTARA